MKFFALLLFCAAMLLVSAFPDEVLIKCEHCFGEDKEVQLVCARSGFTVDTYYNKCVMTCMGAELLHEGLCIYEDVLNNQLQE